MFLMDLEKNALFFIEYSYFIDENQFLGNYNIQLPYRHPTLLSLHPLSRSLYLFLKQLSKLNPPYYSFNYSKYIYIFYIFKMIIKSALYSQ